MKILRETLGLALFASMVASSSAATVFTATLNGSQANAGAGTGSSATGTATLTLNDAGTRLDITIDIFGIDFVGQGGVDTAANDATVFHIHRAPAGANGSVVFGFIGPNSDTNGDLMITPFNGGATIVSGWDETEGNGTTLAAELANLESEGLYLNLHTDAFGAGEIRGQVVPEPSGLLCLSAMMVPTILRRRRRTPLGA